MGLFSDTVPFKGQKYAEIKSNCIKKGALFVDPTFPPSGRSLYYKRAAPSDIVWKRPGVSDAGSSTFIRPDFFISSGPLADSHEIKGFL